MDKIKVVIIGMGRMGRTRYDAMLHHGGYEIVGICDSNSDLLSKYSIPHYSEWKKCINECNPDAVFVCTFNDVIPEIVCYSLDHGKHVFSEKPPGRNLNDTRLMKKASERNPNCKLKFGFNHRYHSSIIETKALIESGILGDVVCARGVYGKAGSEGFQEEWRNQRNISGGGIMLDQGIHMLDLMYYFMGKFTNIQSSVDHLVWQDMATEDSAFSILRTEDGRVASLHSSAIQWRHKFCLDLICTEGFISLNGLLTSTNSYGEEKISYYRKDLAGKDAGIGKPTEHTLCFDEDHSWDYEIKEFYDAIIYSLLIEQGTINDAINLMEMIDSIYG